MGLSTSKFTSHRYSLIALGLLAIATPVLAQNTARSIPAAPIIPGPDAPVIQTANAPVTPAAVVDPQAKALLDQVLARYRALKSYSVTSERVNRKQLIEFLAPQSLKITTLDSDGTVRSQQIYTDTEIISTRKTNDKDEWISTPLPKPVGTGEVRTQLATNSDLLLSSFLAGVNPFESSNYPASSLALGKTETVNGVAVTPIVASIPKTARVPYEQTVSILVGPDKLIQRIRNTLQLPNGKSGTRDENFSQIRADAALSASTFVFTPPAGAVKVERFSPPTARATVGQLPLSLGAATKDIAGKAISFEQYKGKVVLVDFWATWCGPCKAELPNVKANYKKYHDQGFDVLGISLDQKTDLLTKYIAQNDLPWRQVFDGYWDGPIASAFNVRAIPSTFLIGKDGKITAVGVRGDKLEPAIQAALAAPAPLPAE